MGVVGILAIILGITILRWIKKENPKLSALSHIVAILFFIIGGSFLVVGVVYGMGWFPSVST